MAPPKAAGESGQGASPLSPKLEQMEQRRRSLLQTAAMLSQGGHLEAAERSVAQADEVAHSIYGMLQQRARTDANVYRLLGDLRRQVDAHTRTLKGLTGTH